MQLRGDGEEDAACWDAEMLGHLPENDGEFGVISSQWFGDELDCG